MAAECTCDEVGVWGDWRCALAVRVRVCASAGVD